MMFMVFHGRSTTMKQTRMLTLRAAAYSNLMLGLMLGLVWGLGGCSEWSTYPTVEVKAGTVLARSESRSVVDVMAASIEYTQDNLVKGQDLAINLPKGTPAEAYDKVIAKLGDGRVMLNDADEAIHVQEVRTRGMNAEVDLIFPRADGLNQLVTLRLERTLFEMYSVKDYKFWQLRSVATPAANYVAPPVPPAPAPTPAAVAEEPRAKQPTITEKPRATTSANTTNDVPRQSLVPG